MGLSKSSGWSVSLALCAVAGLLWAAIFMRRWEGKPKLPTEAAGPSVPQPPPPALPGKPPAVLKTEEGRSASRILGLLSDARVAAEVQRTSGTPATPAQKEQAASVAREAQELSRALAANLRKNPDSWPEVLDVASGTDDLKIALQLASALGEAMDEAGEGTCIARLMRSDRARGRQVAAAALAGGKTPASLTALIDGADRDADGGVRYSAVTSLAQRRVGSSPETQLSIESALRRRAQSDSDEYIRQVAKNLIEPEPPPGSAKPATAKKRLIPPTSAQK